MYQRDPPLCLPKWAVGCFSVMSTWTSPSQEYRTHTETHEPLQHAPDEQNTHNVNDELKCQRSYHVDYIPCNEIKYLIT